MHYEINTPLTKNTLIKFKAGDTVSISGTIYAARDAAHKRLIEILNTGGNLPINIDSQTIYYVGPCPAKPGKVIGSCGPTTSGRMDAYAPKLIELGLKGMIGKGSRSKNVIEAMIKHKAVYMGVIGGLGALTSKYVLNERIIAFPDLGPEAIRELEVRDFPVVVIIDAEGNNLYDIGKNTYSSLT